MSHAAHEHKAYSPKSVGFAIITVSDSRDLFHDASGGILADLAQAAGHHVHRRAVTRDERDGILHALRDAMTEGVDIILLTGGTGVARRDVTIDTVAPRFSKAIPGFGELFRWISFQEIGTPAMASRAEAGVIADRLVFILPGSPEACRLAMERLILPEAAHLVGQMRR